MTKIMLVEDDKSLREIYGVRLLAEGYDIVSAGDGEEALAMAIKERPQLIISDVMMPKISGFDLLDILRSTTETKNIRVIMMTALSSEDQRQRGEQLGADRYLVKSQVGIEDVVRVVHEVLEDSPVAAAAAPAAPPAVAAPTPVAPLPAPAPVIPQPPTTPPVMPAMAPQPAAPVAAAAPIVPLVPPPAAPTPVAPPVIMPSPVAPPEPAPVATPAPLPIPAPAPPTPPEPPQARARIIQPLNDPTIAQVNINDLLDREIAKEAGLALDTAPTQPTFMPQPDDSFQPISLPEPMSVDNIPTVTVGESGDFQTQSSEPAQPTAPTPQPAAPAPSAPSTPPPAPTV